MIRMSIACALVSFFAMFPTVFKTYRIKCATEVLAYKKRKGSSISLNSCLDEKDLRP